MKTPDMIYNERYVFTNAGNTCISMFGVLPSWGDLIGLSEPHYDFGGFFSVKVIEVTKYLIVVPLSVLSKVVLSVKAKIKNCFSKPKQIASRIFHSTSSIIRKSFTMRL